MRSAASIWLLINARRGEERRDEERWARTRLPKKFGSDEVDKAFSPARLLLEQKSALAIDHVPNGFLLIRPKLCQVIARANAKQAERSGGVVQ